MSRPFNDDLIRGADLLEQLGHRHDSRNNPNGFPDFVSALDLFVWIDSERGHAKAAAVYGPGTDTAGAASIGRHGLSPVEARLHFGPRARPELRDPLYRRLTELQRTWLHQLGQDVDQWMQQSREAANWPHRTQTG